MNPKETDRMQIVAYGKDLSERNIERIEMSESAITRAYTAYKASKPTSRTSRCIPGIRLSNLFLLFDDDMVVIKKVIGIEAVEVGEVRL